MSPSKEGENLYLYLAVSATVVSATLIREEDRRQLSVYYVGEAFQGVEAKYPRIEKIAFTLVVASCESYLGDDGPTYKEGNEQA